MVASNYKNHLNDKSNDIDDSCCRKTLSINAALEAHLAVLEPSFKVKLQRILSCKYEPKRCVTEASCKTGNATHEDVSGSAGQSFWSADTEDTTWKENDLFQAAQEIQELCLQIANSNIEEDDSSDISVLLSCIYRSLMPPALLSSRDLTRFLQKG